MSTAAYFVLVILGAAALGALYGIGTIIKDFLGD